MRVEYGSDPWVSAPEGQPWTHSGHTITISSDMKGEGGVGGEPSSSGMSSPTLAAHAYRFDQNRPPAARGTFGGVGGGVSLSAKGGSKGRAHHELRSYVYALERIANLGLLWPKDYVGEDVGGGIRANGRDREKRLVV